MTTDTPASPDTENRPEPTEPPEAAAPTEPTESEAPAETAATTGPVEPARAASPARPPRTARLLLAVVLLGPLLGAGVGYAVQAARPATPLPPLSVDTLHYPAEPLDPAAAAAAEPKPLAIDGDLRKLLVGRPADAEDWDDYGVAGTGWLTAGGKAMMLGDSAAEYRRLMQHHFRRDAMLAYHRGDVDYRIELIQFGADDMASVDGAFTILVPRNGGALDGTVNGHYEAPREPEHYADSTEQFYYARATAVRGTVVMHIEMFSPNPVDGGEIKELAMRQWERLK
ncbi:hypothetical protein BX265_3269 [Streptomyces sp. TLI_235]|nr:hypothetical protein [Streptomyces sp. TLI_235]PBC78497.1 hypothetical protein BX265_3269 [Streptomyces sp. TLI_235]